MMENEVQNETPHIVSFRMSEDELLERLGVKDDEVIDGAPGVYCEIDSQDGTASWVVEAVVKKVEKEITGMMENEVLVDEVEEMGHNTEGIEVERTPEELKMEAPVAEETLPKEESPRYENGLKALDNLNIF